MNTIIDSNANTAAPMGRWYIGGIASAGGACCTHPLDLIKVTLQTQQQKLSVVPLTSKIVRNQGIKALYSGLSASDLRQKTFSTTRFWTYEVGKEKLETETDTLTGKIILAGLSGADGGLVGTPAGMVNVRLQNDVKLPAPPRRNYKKAFDGLIRIYQSEGCSRQLFLGASTTVSRGALMTSSQIVFYDQIKSHLLSRPDFRDDLRTHFVASLGAGAGAGAIATTITQPIDVLKTRIMNARPGESSGFWDGFKSTARLGPLGFNKGYIPALVRLVPLTILNFIFLEQLKRNFGVT